MFYCLCISTVCIADNGQQTAPLVQHKNTESMQLRLHIERQEIGVADYLTLRLIVQAPTDRNVRFQTIDDTLGPFRVVSRHPLGPLTLSDQRQQWQREYILQAEQAGELSIPALTVELHRTSMAQDTSCALFLNCQQGGRGTTQRADSLQQSLSTDPVLIQVNSVVPEDAVITDIKDIATVLDLPPPVKKTASWWWLAGGVLLLLVIGIWRFLRKAAKPTPVIVHKPAHSLALEALKQLQEQGLLSERAEEFYIKLSIILRHYVLRRFGLQAPKQTTEEFLSAVKTSDTLAAERYDLLGRFLHACDRVKFARQQSDDDEMQKALHSVRSFIEQTAADDADMLLHGQAERA